MKRSLTVLALTLCLASSAFAQTLTPADRDQAIQYLESTRQGVLTATAGLSGAQWNFKSAPDRWSIAEVTEHIAAAEDFLMVLVTSKVMPAPPRPAGDDVKAIDAMVLANVPDRSHKAQAPEPLKPTNRFGSPEGSLKHFTEPGRRPKSSSNRITTCATTPSTVLWARSWMPASGFCSWGRTRSGTPSRLSKSRRIQTFPGIKVA
jgi:hypothetical protein